MKLRGETSSEGEEVKANESAISRMRLRRERDRQSQKQKKAQKLREKGLECKGEFCMLG